MQSGSEDVRVGTGMSVKIKRERPDQRRHHRVTAPLFVTWGGSRLKAADWSLGGLRLEQVPGDLPAVGDEIGLHLTLPFQGFDVGFDITAAVVRTDPANGMLAVRYVEIGERERELMTHFLEELVRGSMQVSDIEDTIQRIDVPVTPASLKPDANPLKEMPVKRWPTRAIVMTSIYIALGVMVFGYAGLLLYSNFFRMEVQTAVISAPIETVTSQADGQLKLAGVKPGDTVKPGEVLLEVVDSQLQREIDLASIAVKEQKAKLGSLRQRHLEELERIKSFATVEMKNIRQTKRELEALTEQLSLAEKNLSRQKLLNDKGFTTELRYEEARRAAVTLRKEVDIRRIELAARIELSQQNVGKRMYTGHETIGSGDIQGKLAEIETEIRLAEHEIQIAQQRYIANLEHRQRQSVRAPFGGTVLELPRVENSNVRRGDIIAIVEEREKRQVTAYLNQDEVVRIGLGDEATLFIPALAETMKARVARIDRTTGFVEEEKRAQNPGYRWRGPVDRSARVLLEFADPAKVKNADKYRSGLPVVVVFPQRSSSPILNAIRQRFITALH